MLDIEIGMAAELREAPEAVRRQEAAAEPIAELVARCRRNPPQVVVTCARGSSAHAATFGKHLIERHLGIPVAAAAPNIATVYDQRLKLKDQLVLDHLAIRPQRRSGRVRRDGQGNRARSPSRS